MSNNMKKALGAIVIIALVAIAAGMFIHDKLEENKKMPSMMIHRDMKWARAVPKVSD